MAKFNFKKGDIVEVIAGDDKGTKAEVLAVMPKKNKVIVKGCKVAKKTIKPTEDNPKGGFTNKEMPIDVSNVRKVEAE
jgi:large subunit ribosomal protein L24